MAGSNFEIQLGQLADTQINQEAPSLMPYKVGFQLLDKNDDETRGVGVMVYKLVQQWIYIPVFYLNGRIKGTNIMYLPARDQFLPVKENWISHLRGQQPLELGEAIGDSGMLAHSRGQPGTVNLTEQDPFLKGAALLRKAAWERMTSAARFEQDSCDLRAWVPRLGKEAAMLFTATLREQPDFANAILRYYTPDDLVGLAKQADEVGTTPAEWPAKAAPATREAMVQVITPDMPQGADLGDEAKEVLVRDGVYIIDKRPETSTVFDGEIDRNKLSTPSATGLYDVLLADGSFQRFYVFKLRKDLDSPDAGKNAGRSSSVDGYLASRSGSAHHRLILVSMDAQKNYLEGHNNIQAARVPLRTEDDTRILGALGAPARSSLVDNTGSSDAVLADTHGKAYKIYLGYPRTAVGGRLSLASPSGYGREETAPSFSLSGALTSRRVSEVAFTGKPGSLFIGGQALFVPEDARVLYPMEYKDAAKYSFGDGNTVAMSLITKLNLRPLRVFCDGSQVTLSNEQVSEGPLAKKAALVKLVVDYGIDAAVAKRMLKEAARSGRPNSHCYLVKRAAASIINAERQPTTGMKSAPQSYDEATIKPGGLFSSNVQDVVKASDSGIKEVMDVTVLRTLAMSSRSLEIVQEYVPDLLKALDRLGRLLFLFYWHAEDFQERYGSSELAELESSLRDIFHSLSDLVLFLSKKTVLAEPSMAGVAGDLSENLGT